jgi:hypothetical protein
MGKIGTRTTFYGMGDAIVAEKNRIKNSSNFHNYSYTPMGVITNVLCKCQLTTPPAKIAATSEMNHSGELKPQMATPL